TLFKAGLAQLIYATHDGGATWTGTTPLHDARNLDIVTMRDIWAVESAGAAAGSATRPLHLYVTHDGGLRWAAIGPNKAIRDGATLDFVDNQTGFVLYPALGSGSTTALLKTVDGGHSWFTIHPYVLPRSSRGIHPDTVRTSINVGRARAVCGTFQAATMRVLTFPGAPTCPARFSRPASRPFALRRCRGSTPNCTAPWSGSMMA